MRITCRRFEYGNSYTASRLYVDGVYECFVLEDKVREKGVKVDGQTAIPAGIYRLTIDYSPRFNKQLIHILNVPGFEGVRIHSGNTVDDTEGCLLVGKSWSENKTLYSSREAYLNLALKIAFALERQEKVLIEIVDTKEEKPL